MSKDFTFIVTDEEIQKQAKTIIERELSDEELKKITKNLEVLFQDWRRASIGDMLTMGFCGNGTLTITPE